MKEQAPTVCFLTETRLDKEGFDKLYGNLPYQNKVIVKHLDSGGGLALYGRMISIWKLLIILSIMF